MWSRGFWEVNVPADRPEHGPVHSPSLAGNTKLDDWIQIESDGTVVIRSGKVEIGQGLCTALTAIAADELDLAIGRVRVRMADSRVGPNEMYTASSQSVEDSGGAIRKACATARAELLRLAAAQLGCARELLELDDGTIRAPTTGASVTYWELMAGRSFSIEVDRQAIPKPAHALRVVGREGIRRVDLSAKVFGQPVFVQDLRLEGMVYGRMLRPPSPGARLLALDPAEVRTRPDVIEVVVDGSFVGVIAAREFAAIDAVRRLRELARWQETASYPVREGVHAYLRAHVSHRVPVIDGVARDEAVRPHPAPTPGARLVESTATRPHILHGSLGPSAAVARFSEGDLTVWTSNQGVSLLAPALGQALSLPAERIHVIHVEGPGSYGHNAAEDAAFDAAVLAMAVAPRPVSLQWTREDEHCWEPFGPAMQVTIQAGISPDGDICDWRHDIFGTSHLGRATPQGERCSFLGAWYRAKPMQPPISKPWIGAPQLGGHRNALPKYRVPNPSIVEHFVAQSPFRTSTLRSLGAHLNVLAIEGVVDQLAELAEVDPVAFRLRHLDDPRARAVLERLAAACDWSERASAEKGSGRALGIGFGQYKNAKTYAAVAVDIEVAEETCEPTLLAATIVADAGRIIDPDGLRQQLEGGLIQSASWTLFEGVTFDATRITSVDWGSYPILGFEQIPQIDTILIDRPEEPSVGAGEAAQGPTAAAIGNALARALGLRLERLPFNAKAIKAAMLA